jgi:TatD DNase family protein
MADRHNRDIDRPRAPLPEALPVPTVDAHAHMEIVTDAAFDSQEVADVIAEAKAVNVDRIVQVGYSAEQSKWCVAAAEKWNTTVLAAVALHPNEAPVVADLEADLKIIEELAQHPRVRAIGETGLDYFRTPPELRKRQQDSFKWHIELAKKTNKALVIHDRDAVAFIQGMSPVAWQHVNMFGSFEFSDEEPTVDLEELAERYADSEFWAKATQSGQGDLFD